VNVTRIQFLNIRRLARQFMTEVQKPAPELILQDLDANLARLDKLIQRASEERASLFMSRLYLFKNFPYLLKDNK
jgi:hypothetical protein